MNALSQILGALIEAWGEVKVQKARVVLSLVGVATCSCSPRVNWRNSTRAAPSLCA